MTRRAHSARAPSQRQLRVGEEIRHALAEVLERGDIRDPELERTPVTVTEVRVSPDLRAATVFVVPLGGGHEPEVLAGLKRARGYLRGQLAKRLTLRTVPDLSFQPDTTFDNAQRIDLLLRDARVAGDLAEPAPDSDSEVDVEGERRDGYAQGQDDGA